MTTILRGARVFDGAGFGGPRDIAMVDGLIAEAPSAGAGVAGFEVVDAAGGYLLPGLIDCHIHLSGPETLARLAAHGVTTGLDMSSPPPLVRALRGAAGRAGPVADLRSGLMALTCPRSAHAERMRGVPAARESLVDGPEEAEAAVARRVRQGADYIKVVVDLPGFDLETVAAIVDAAHRHSLLVVAHASRSDAVELARRAGVDVLTHVPLDRAIDAAEAAEIAAAGTLTVPTLAMMRGIVDAAGSGPGPSYEPARASVRALHDAGATILAGTDANRTPAAPASPPFGESLHDELGLLVDAGLAPVEALRAATCDAAAHFGLADRGRVEPGLRADLVLLAADPGADISASRRIRGVWVAGEAVRGAGEGPEAR